MKAVLLAARPRRPHSRRPHRRVAALLALGTLGSVVLTSSPPSSAAGVVSGTVYRDSNNNGVHDPDEAGVPGVVVAAGPASTVTDGAGAWSMTLTGQVKVRVVTGWYRSQCDSMNCGAGPGADQDFSAENQMVVTTVSAETNPVVDTGIVPDWQGSYPMPNQRPVPANAVDVSSRVSFIAPTGAAASSNCFRTAVAANRACAIGDQPTFLAQIYNEGTTPITDPSGFLQLPPGTSFVSIAPSVAPANSPTVGEITLGAFDPALRRVPFVITGALALAAAALYTVTLAVTPDAPITRTFQTGGGYPNQIGIRVTNVAGDIEGDNCAPTAAKCAWGVTDNQVWPDNSDTVGFAIVPAVATPTPPTSAAPATTLPPTTTRPPTTTVPATTTTRPPTTTVPATTTTRPPTTTTRPPTTTTRPPTTTTRPPTTTTRPPTTTTRPPTTTTAPTKPPATTPTQPTGGECTVSALLVPSCGAWLGASTAAKSGKLGSADYSIGLNEYEAVARNTPDILHFYKSGAAKFPNTAEIAMANRNGKQRSLLLYNWKPSTSLTWRQVADGGADSAIQTVATSLKTYPHKVFLTVWHEPENDLGVAGSGRTPADYVAMYRHVVTKLRSLGVTNAVFVMNYMGFTKWSTVVDQLYPGADVIDWIAYDPYGFSTHKDFASFLDTPKSPWQGFYTWATTKAPGKPIMLGEWGFDLDQATQAPAVLDGASTIIQARFPMLKALVYWNDDNDTLAVRLDQSSSLGVQYGNAYARMANDPYFNATSTAGAP